MMNIYCQMSMRIAITGTCIGTGLSTDTGTGTPAEAAWLSGPLYTPLALWPGDTRKPEGRRKVTCSIQARSTSVGAPALVIFNV